MAVLFSASRALEKGTRLTERDIQVICEAIRISKYSEIEMQPLYENRSNYHHVINTRGNSKIELIKRTKRLVEEFRNCLIIVEGNGRNLWEAIGYRSPVRNPIAANLLMQHLTGFTMLPDPFTDEFFRRLSALANSCSSTTMPSAPDGLHTLMIHFLTAYRSINGAIKESLEQCRFLKDVQISAGYLLYTVNQLKHQLPFVKVQMDAVEEDVRAMMKTTFNLSKSKTTIWGRLDAEGIAAIDQALNATVQAGEATLADITSNRGGHQSGVEDYFEFSDVVLEVLQEFEKCLTVISSNTSGLKISLRGKDQVSLDSVLENLRDPFTDTFFLRLNALARLPSPRLGQPLVNLPADGAGKFRGEDMATFMPLMFQMMMSKLLPLIDVFGSHLDAWTRDSKNFSFIEFDMTASKFSAQASELRTFLKGCSDRIAGDRTKVRKAIMDGGRRPTIGAMETLMPIEDMEEEIALRMKPVSSITVGVPVSSARGVVSTISYPILSD